MTCTNRTENSTPVNIILVTDPGKDLDDENTLVLLRGLQEQELIGSLQAVVAVLTPAVRRAQLAKGTLKILKYDNVPVGIGSNCGVADTGQSNHEFEGISYLAGEEELEDGDTLLLKSLQSAQDKSITWLLVAGMTNVAQLLKDQEDLFKAKTSSVVIMGGIKEANNQVVLNEAGMMEPDSAQNNEYDRAAAEYIYKRLQELSIPMTVLTRFAAGAAPVPRNHYDHLAATGNPIGIKLKGMQQKLIEALWKRANYAEDDPRREKLPARCNKTWFLDFFCGGTAGIEAGKDRNENDSIWDLVLSFALYDPLSAMAAVPSLCERFYEPEVVTVNGVEHKIIGLSKSKHGIKDGKEAADFLARTICNAMKNATDS